METSNGHIESHLLEHETIRCLYHPESGFIDNANNHKNLLYLTSERLLYSQENSETSKTSLISIRDINSIEFHNDQQKRFSGLIWASISILVAILSLVWNQPIWTPLICLIAIGLTIYFIVEHSTRNSNKIFSISSGNSNIQISLNEKAVEDAIKLTKLIYSLKSELINETHTQRSTFALR